MKINDSLTRSIAEAAKKILTKETEIQPVDQDFVDLHTVDDKEDPEQEQQIESINIEEADVNSDEEFKDFAYAVLKKAHGDKFDKEIADKAIADILDKADGDYGTAIGILTSGLGEEIEEGVEQDRYMRVHGKNASGKEKWIFTTKRFGDVDYDNDKEFYQHPTFDTLENAGKAAMKALGTKSVYVMESTKINEVLKPSDELKTWIDDFIKSDDPRFEGKSKDERIKMALGAYYAAQKKEEAFNWLGGGLATSEKSQLGGYRPKIIDKKTKKVMYLSAARYKTPQEAKDHAEEYLKQKAKGIRDPKVPFVGTFQESDCSDETVDEAANTAQKRSDMAKVNAGAMSRDEYNKKYKLGKYSTGKGLAGPGGLYKNLVKKEEEDLEEAVEKIACLQCDAVSTKAAWQKNKGFCPVCKVSSQGVAESKIEESEVGEINEALHPLLKQIEKKIYRGVTFQDFMTRATKVLNKKYLPAKGYDHDWFLDEIGKLMKVELEYHPGEREGSGTGYVIVAESKIEEAATPNDLKKILDTAKKLGATIKGNTADFGMGSVIGFSIEKGKIKFDGGTSSGVEYFNNVKDAISALTAGAE